MILIMLGKMIACSGILYAYYWFFLRNRRFHHYNRFYLLASTALSVIIPFIRIPVFFESNTVTGQLVNRSFDLISVNHWEKEFVENPEAVTSSWFTLQNALLVSYAIVVLVMVYFLGRSLLYILRISRKYPYEYFNNLKFYNTAEPGTPFSFFQSIFWNSRLDFNSREGQQIFRHELFHVKQKHSADILFLEFVSILFWVNPLFHLIKKEIKAIHEFLADQHAVSDANQLDYAELLILQSINAWKNPISNYFFQNHIKRRIAMITSFKNNHYSYWTRLMVLPLSLILFCSIALYAQNADSNVRNIDSSPLPKSITVLVDAGHGGKDLGAKGENGLLEKDLALSIAQQLKLHADAFNIKVIMTREQDIYPSLRERTDLAKTVGADMLISVHVAAAPVINTEQGLIANPKNGFEIFITNRNQHTLPASKLLGENIASQIRRIYTVSGIKQSKQQGIRVLDSVSCPAVLIECGFITNENDVAFITNPENQEKIAKSILEGVVNYKKLQVNSTAFMRPANTGKQNIPGLFHINQLAEQKPEVAFQSHLVSAVPPNVFSEEDTLPKKMQVDSVKQKEIELEYLKLAEQHQRIQHQKELLIKKDQEIRIKEIQSHNEARINAQLEDIQKKKELLAEQQEKLQQMNREINRAQSDANKSRVNQKQHKIELAQLDSENEREIELAQQALAEADLRRKQQNDVPLKKNREINAKQQALANQRKQETLSGKDLVMEKHKKMELAGRQQSDEQRRKMLHEKQLQLKLAAEDQINQPARVQARLEEIQRQKQILKERQEKLEVMQQEINKRQLDAIKN